MANSPPQLRHMALPSSTSPSFDENSPLLQKPDRTFGNGASGEDDAPKTEGKAFDTASVLCIMVSVWIGTATA